MRIPLLHIILSLSLPGTAVFAAEPLTLEAYLRQVQGGNPSLQAAALRADAQRERIQPASTWDDPFFAVGPDEIPFSGEGNSMLRFQLSQSIPFPGKLGARGDAAGRRADAASADAEIQRRQVTVAATQAYYRTYYNRKAIELNERTRRLIEEVVESSRARYRTGDSNHHEWLLAKVELSVLGADRLRLQREQGALHGLVNELRNQGVNTPIEFPKLSFDEPPVANQKPELDGQPELKALSAVELAAQADYRAARLSYFPDFVIQGMAMKSGHSELGEPSNWGLMVGVNLPLFFFRKQSNLSAAAQMEADAAAAERKGLENRLRSEAVDAESQFKTALDIVRLYKNEVIPVTELAAKNARTAYSTRKAPLNQYIETLRVQRTQELELLAAQIDVELGRTRIKELLSSPPVLRLAPTRPSLFGAGGMSGGMGGGMEMGSGTVNMGRGMSGPTRGSESSSQPSGEDGGMQNMGGM